MWLVFGMQMVLSLNLSPLYLPLHVGHYLSWGNLDLYMRGSFLENMIKFTIYQEFSLLR
jgi:hypothetical protein